MLHVCNIDIGIDKKYIYISDHLVRPEGCSNNLYYSARILRSKFIFRVEGVENLECKAVDGLVTSETSGLVDELKIMSKTPELIVDINQNVPDIKKTNATSIIETVEVFIIFIFIFTTVT